MSYFVRLWVFLILLVAASGASAQLRDPLPPGSTVALLQPGGDVEPLGLEQTIVTAALDALRSMSYLAIAPEQVAEELKLVGDASCLVPKGCDQAKVLDVLGVDAVASVVVWLDEEGKRPNHVIVKITRPANWGVGEVRIEDRGLNHAVGVAVAEALRDTQVRHHVMLRVEATPENARVEIDHRRVGDAPAVLEIAPGRRVITVSADGYQTESNYVDVPANVTGAYIYKISLSQSREHSPRLEAADSLRGDPLLDNPSPASSPWNYVIGSGLLVASAALLTPALINAVNDGDCYEKDEFGRCNRYLFGVQSTLLMLAGLVALAGGVAFILFEPIEGNEPITLGFGPSRLKINGRF
ncbi:MAG: PEGA domain-containing protein [Deltaproteobacteria bacterium]|nr:PEGA domain-containing protein [Deltaproteobacteria bacterium]